jgi:amidase
MFVTMAGSHGPDPLSLRDPLPSADHFQPTPLAGLRVGWLGDLEGHLPMEDGVLSLCEASLAVLADAGVIVERCRVDFDMDRLWRTWLTLRHWSRNGQWLRELYDDPATRSQLKPEAIWEYEGCLNTSARDVYDAGVARADWYRVIHDLFDDYHVLVVPSAQVFPFDKTIHWPRTVAGRDMDTYHRWMEVVIGASLAGIPSGNVPVGTDDAGRPMGMQVMGPFGEDRRVLEFALAYELVTGHLEQRPTLVEGGRSRDSHAGRTSFEDQFAD